MLPRRPLIFSNPPHPVRDLSRPAALRSRPYSHSSSGSGAAGNGSGSGGKELAPFLFAGSDAAANNLVLRKMLQPTSVHLQDNVVHNPNPQSALTHLGAGLTSLKRLVFRSLCCGLGGYAHDLVTLAFY